MQKIRLHQITYDARRGAYLARVDVERDGRVFRYPCEVRAPQGMDPAWVMNALTRHALSQSDTRHDGRTLH